MLDSKETVDTIEIKGRLHQGGFAPKGKITARAKSFTGGPKGMGGGN